MKIGVDGIEDMTVQQRRVFDRMVRGRRGRMTRPFYAMVASPEVADKVQAVGEYLRFESPLDAKLRELAIVTVAWTLKSGHEYDAHVKIAREVGVEEAAIRFATHHHSEHPHTTERDVVLFVRALLSNEHRRPSQSQRLIETLGQHAFSDLVAVCGYYRMLANFLSVGELDHLPVYNQEVNLNKQSHCK